MLRTLLIALDGEPHTQRALRHALDLGQRYDATLIGLHVVDPYLKQFHNEIYAVGRQEYLDYVDQRLREDAERILREFVEYTDKEGVRAETRIRYGSPLEEIAAESGREGIDLLIVGGKSHRGIERWRSGRLHEKLIPLVEIPLLIVRP